MISFFGKKKAPTGIFFYNTLGHEKQKFEPLRDRYVKMYTCGPTVYDYAHIGNLRAYIFADSVRRVLEYRGYDVKQVMNITDFGHLVGDGDEGEDKMTAGLKREGLAPTLANMHELGTRYMDAFVEDLKALNIELPFVMPRASEHIPDQIAYVETLLNKGYAYKTSDGIYFDVEKFPAYGALGGVSASEEHSRVGVSAEKHDPRDFALWKFDEKVGWDAPWGKGFPGWHIECVAMSTRHLGKTFDIHTGGIDHIAIHHNNEIAEAAAANSKPLARFWMHGAFITVEGKRIGKSEGNAIRLYQLEERGVSALAYRYLCLTAHYRQTMNFTWESAESAQTALKRAQRFYADLSSGPHAARPGKISEKYRAAFEAAIDDDLNTPAAIAVMWDLIKDDAVPPSDKRETLLDFDRVLGIGFRPLQYRSDAAERLAVVSGSDVPGDVQTLLDEREAARTAGEWAKADELREKIYAEGFSVEDTESGPVLRRE
ncbi:MAG: cysteine--tRNA ligase [Patescibacteria group bacterium]|nr:cysteine--tRNA ligase [Patescibacteria group bacterium]